MTIQCPIWALRIHAPVEHQAEDLKPAAALAELGAIHTVCIAGQGDQAREYHLNRRQAIFITAKCGTPNATDITIEIIERFDAYERGVLPPARLTIPFHKCVITIW